MEVSNLAIVYGPTIIRPPGSTEVSSAIFYNNMSAQNAIVNWMISEVDYLFDRLQKTEAEVLKNYGNFDDASQRFNI